MKNKIHLSLIGMIFIIIVISICSLSLNSSIVYASKLTISDNSLNLAVGARKTLVVKGTNNKITWSSSDKSIARVDTSGTITALNTGLVTIKAKTGNTVLKCNITVTSPKLNATSINKIIGKTCYINVSGTNGKVKYTTENSAIAKVDSEGLVTAVGCGETKIDVLVDYKTFKVSFITEPVPQFESLYYMSTIKKFSNANKIGHKKSSDFMMVCDYVDNINDYDFKSNPDHYPVYDTYFTSSWVKDSVVNENYTDVYLLGSSQTATVTCDNNKYLAVRYIAQKGYGIIRVWNRNGGGEGFVTIKIDGYTYKFAVSIRESAGSASESEPYDFTIDSTNYSSVRSTTSSFWPFDLDDRIKSAITDKVISICVDAFFAAAFGL